MGVIAVVGLVVKLIVFGLIDVITKRNVRLKMKVKCNQIEKKAKTCTLS